MSKRIVTSICFIAMFSCCLLLNNVFAQAVISVSAGDSTLRLAIDGAADGDIIELVTSGGVYE